MALTDLIQQDAGIMPFVRFERIAVEDAAASREAGHYVAKDVDMANITPPYSKDVMKYKVVAWLGQLKIDAMNARIPADWVEKYTAAYEAWKRGQEMPVDGYPIKGWGVISPAQQETLIKLHILTVESLAAANDEGLRRIGMGAHDLKNKADAWLKQLKKAGPATVEIAALKKENAGLLAAVSGLEKQVSELSKLVEQVGALQQGPMTAAIRDGIGADDLLGDDD
ncbi:MAG: hypothetical protein M0R47_16610 [Methylobacter sp.]|uniref:hypothetical protein n=1 Tax=Methylobacter sp. TaxID=2051955 RepID=UPI0025CB8605|nr:hypothetical protein [Methylobacter sp.]MCK9622144.1 hypothetical protein [Methylobacter sp.]